MSRLRHLPQLTIRAQTPRTHMVHVLRPRCILGPQWCCDTCQQSSSPCPFLLDHSMLLPRPPAPHPSRSAHLFPSLACFKLIGPARSSLPLLQEQARMPRKLTSDFMQSDSPLPLLQEQAVQVSSFLFFIPSCSSQRSSAYHHSQQQRAQAGRSGRLALPFKVCLSFLLARLT